MDAGDNHGRTPTEGGADRTGATPVEADSPAKGPAEGEIVGPYRVEREIGRGGQGRVFEAVDRRLGRRAALKVLTSAAPKAAERFKREAEAAARTTHPGVCPVYDVGVDDAGRAYIAMRLVEGETLARRIGDLRRARDRGDDVRTADLFAPRDDAGPRSEAEALASTLRGVEAIARAVHAAHECGVVHRDLKPGNVMIERDGTPVVLDFGLAGLLDSAAGLTRTGEIFGTPAYMSPEQIAPDREKPDRRTDVYALGVLLFEATTLRRPFDKPTRDALFSAILAEDAPDLRAARAFAPKDLAAVVAVALEKEPRRRYPTALAFAEDLRRVQEGEPVLAKPPRTFERLLRRARRRPLEAGLLFALLIGAPIVASLATSYLAGRPLAEARARAASREEAEATLARAVDATFLGDPRGAIAAIEAALELDPTAPEAAPLLFAARLRLDPSNAEAEAGLSALADGRTGGGAKEAAWIAALARALTPTVAPATRASVDAPPADAAALAFARAEEAFRATLLSPVRRAPSLLVLKRLADAAVAAGKKEAASLAAAADAALASLAAERSAKPRGGVSPEGE